MMDAEKEGLLTDMEVTQICVVRILGSIYMMTGMNPVYIISAGERKMASNFDHDLQRRENSKSALMAVYQAQNKKYHPVNGT